MNIKHALIVVEDPATNKPVVFGKEINSQDDILPAVEEFFEEKDIPVDYTVVENIENVIAEGKHFWYDERYCFQIVDIYCQNF